MRSPFPQVAALRRLLVVCVVAAYAWLACAGVGLVRCYESDGSVRFEWRSAGCCAAGDDLRPGSQWTSPEDDCDEGSCDSCTDVPVADLLVGRIVAHANQTKAPFAASPATPPVVEVFRAWNADPRIGGRTPLPPQPPPLPASRSAVLRC